MSAVATLPAWLPDWRRPELYPPPSSPGRIWQWEFLRRNAEYQKLWAQLSAPTRWGMPFEPFRAQFGVLIPLDPATPFNGANSVDRSVKEWADGTLLQLEKNKRCYEFDLSRSRSDLKDQFDLTFKWAERERAVMIRQGTIAEVPDRRERFDNYREYLRALDASARRISAPEVAKNFFPRLDRDRRLERYKKILAKAKRLRDREFRSIPIG